MIDDSGNFDQISSAELDAVKQKFYSEGLSVADWARSNGFSSQLTYSLLAGRLRARRGEAHRIAVALGLKPAARAQRLMDRGDLAATRFTDGGSQ